jgi:hypothetical protein
MDWVFLLKVIKALAEVAGLALIGQGIVALFAGNTRDQNFVYVLFKIITGPATKLARIVSPRFVPDRHIPWVAFGLVLWVWVLAIIGIAMLGGAPKPA